jgi:hypothetical protein
MRLKKVTKDSIKFQVLQVEDKQILYDKSVVYMTLYADNYIKNVLHTDSATLVRPTRLDTQYIRHKADLAALDPKNAFSARMPATLSSISPLVKVQKIHAAEDASNEVTVADEYLTPEFNITIHKAYEDFNYPMVLLVDAKGQLIFYKSRVVQMPEFAESANKIMTAITNGYLRHYLKVTAGTTLGIPHASKIIVYVRGYKN